MLLFPDTIHRTMRIHFHGFLMACMLACGTDDAPQVVLVVEADGRTTELVEDLRVIVYDNENNLVRDETNPLSASNRIPLTPRDGDLDRKYRVVIEGIAATGDVVVEAEKQGRYQAGQKIERDVRLREQCHFVECGPGMECTEFGVCDVPCDTGSCVLDPRDGAVFVDAMRGTDSETECTNPSTPCETIAAAASYVQNGARRVLVAPGVPYIATSIGSEWSGTEGDPTILQSWGEQKSGRAELIADESGDAIAISETDHFQLIGFSIGAGRGASAIVYPSSSDILFSALEIIDRTFMNPNAQTAAIHIRESTSSVEVRGCEIRGTSGPMGNIGINSGGVDVSIIGNVITDNDNIGIIVSSLASGRIAYNSITGHPSDAIGAYLAENAAPTLIEHNRLCDNLGRGLGINGSLEVMTVRNNTISESTNGIELYELCTGTLRAERNIFYRHDFFGVSVRAGDLSGNHNVFFENGSGPGEFSRPSPDTTIEDTSPGFQTADGCELRLPLEPSVTTDTGEIIGAR